MMSTQPCSESILQFGAGRFLRAFVDRFVQQARDSGQEIGQVAVVQSTAGTRADILNDQPDGFQVLVRGIQDGAIVERVEAVRCISRALQAQTQWPEVLEIACSPALQYIVSNSTEAGFNLSDTDHLNSVPPNSYPAKLTQILWRRFQAVAPPFTVLPCDLIERNADKLRDLVLQLTDRWGLDPDFKCYISEKCTWLNNLVDCIVTSAPADHPLANQDRLLVHAEPYALWAIQKPVSAPPAWIEHPAVQWVDDLAPFYLRKVRILNGLHTAMVGKFLNTAFQTVQQVLADRQAAKWVRGLLFEEIVPTIAWRVPEVAEFADQTWDRLRNPFLAHRLQDIALNHTDKVRVRVLPTWHEYIRLFGTKPRHLSEILTDQPGQP